MNLYETTADYEREVVLPALGDMADDYDTLSIAQDMLTYHEEQDERGRTLINRTGFVERDDVDFWEIVARHSND